MITNFSLHEILSSSSNYHVGMNPSFTSFTLSRQINRMKTRFHFKGMTINDLGGGPEEIEKKKILLALLREKYCW